MPITIEINNLWSRINGALDKKTLGLLNDKLSYEVPGAFFAQRFNPYAGVRRLFRYKSQTFPTGLIHYVEEIFNKMGIQAEIVDLRVPVPPGAELPIKGFTLRDYQQLSVDAAIKKQRGIIKMATGGGKTNAIMGVIAKLNVPTLILIHKTDIFYQLIHRFEKGLGIPIGRIGDGKFQIEKITVGMIQSVSRIYEKGGSDEPEAVAQRAQIAAFVESAQCIITDEAHHVAADTFWTVQQKATSAFYRYGFSASPWRIDNADLLIEAAHARKVIDISASSLIDQGHLVRPTIYLYEFRHERKDRGLKYPDLYDQEVMLNSQRNEVVVKSALKASSQGKTVLIAVTKIEHGQLLESLLKKSEPDTLFVCGESNPELRQTVLEELDQRKRKIVICTTIFGEGIDCPGLDVLINAKAASSSIDAFQLIGRVLRPAPHKKIAYVIDIFDKSCKYIGKHSEDRLEIYQTEPKYLLVPVSQVEQLNFNEERI